ncbi:MAG: hypothetical protein IJU81_04435 [Bacteroidales bacterium]|nr:hypothetical protein [Bacteroidales bacterium]
MKKTLYAALVVAAALLGACTKDAGVAKTFRASAEPATENGKIAYSGGRLLWSADDKIDVRDASLNEAIYGVVEDDDMTRVDIVKVSGTDLSDGPYTAVLPAAIRTGASTVKLPATQTTPDGSLCSLPMYAVSDDVYLKFYNLCGVVRFRLSASSSVSLSRIAVSTNSNTNGASTISGSGKTVSITTPSGGNVTTLACDVAQNIASAKDFYMYLPAGTYTTFRILLTANDGSVCSKNAQNNIVVQRGKITTITLSNLSFADHRFSVSATTSVKFAPGNLQYTTQGTHAVSTGGTAPGTWRFAEHQYDALRSANSSISDSYEGWIDLFGWGTSGWSGGITAYMPTSTITSATNYWPGGDNSKNLTGAYAQADWGVYNAISNGGNTPGQWRTLTGTEWSYLLNHRDDAAGKRGYAEVNNVNGVILLPDSFTDPMLNNGSGVFVGSAQTGWTSNVYTAANWTAMEAAGAVFLPVTGRRDGASVSNTGFGYYWSSTQSSSNSSSTDMWFRESFFETSSTYRYRGCAVRLVKD